jgi:hypothetical protein
MSRLSRNPFVNWDVLSLLDKYPGLSARPQQDKSLIFEGNLFFKAYYKDLEQITDTYVIHIHIPRYFPRELPKVRDANSRIPRDFHTNPDGTLCLGSPIQLFLNLRNNPTLVGFVDTCLIPFLYSYSYKEKFGKMPFGDLAHGRFGIVQDYMRLLRVDSEEACMKMIYLLGVKKRIANKSPCPCQSGRRLGKCHNHLLNSLRDVQSRPWFRNEYSKLTR